MEGWLGLSDKTVISASVDSWIAEELDNHPDVDNKSALIEELLKDWLESGQDSEAAAYRQQIETKREIKQKYEEKIGSIERDIQRFREMAKKAERKERTKFEDVLDRYHNIPSDPEHKGIENIAEEFDMDRMEVARAHADYHDKELQDNNGPDLRSIQ
jgi:hypothetical protein